MSVPYTRMHIIMSTFLCITFFFTLYFNEISHHDYIKKMKYPFLVVVRDFQLFMGSAFSFSTNTPDSLDDFPSIGD